MGLRRVTVEALLRWAYVEELPKAPSNGGGRLGHGSAWGAISEYGSLWTLIDMSNDFGCVPDFSASDGPHPDAVAVDIAVKRTRSLGFVASAGIDLMPEADAVTAEERADCHARGLAIARIEAGQMPAMLARHAMLGRAPDAALGAVVERKVVKGPKGRELWARRVTIPGADGKPTTTEVDGFNPKAQRPFPGAYKRTRLMPDPAGIVAERAEYQAYVLALGAVALDLSGRLERWVVAPPVLRLAPWRPVGEAAATLRPALSTGGEGHGAAAA